MSNEALRIIYEWTEDLLSGEPWMPDGSAFWAIVRGADGHTRWRRITLNQPSTALVIGDGAVDRQP